MKVLLLTVLVLGAALAEPAFRRQQQQQAPQTPQEAEDSEAPYAPSGWKPSGQRLEHPPKQYGAPEEEDAQTEQPAAEPQAPSRSQKKQEAYQQQGEYYVILPDGRLQRVQFAAKVQASPVEGQDNQKDAKDEAADEVEEPASPHGAAPKPVTRPAHRPQPAPQQQQQRQVVFPANPRQGKYYIVLPDGSLQQVEFVANLEATSTQVERDGIEAEAAHRSASRPQIDHRRPQPRPQQVQQRPVVLLPQPTQEMNPVAPSSFVAELRFMEVPPITGPVYSYSEPLVRVQRETL